MPVVIRALLFDCDGTLADTEPLQYRALNGALLDMGQSLTAPEYQEIVGLPDGEAIRAVLGKRGVSCPPETVASVLKGKRAAYRKSLGTGASPVPGAADFVRQAAGAYLLAVATGAWREEVDLVLGGLGIRDLFRTVVTYEDCPAGKPDPAPFLKALEGLNASSPAPEPPLQARECLVFEDSPPGVAAARAAGMRCVGITTGFSGDALRDADLVAPHFRALELRRVTAFFDRRAR